MNVWKQYGLCVLLLLLSACCCWSQTTFSGQVCNAAGKGVPDVSVVVLTDGEAEQILTYALTDGEGRYALTFVSDALTVKIRFSGFNIKTVERQVENKHTTLDQVVKEEVINLREVSVKADKIWQYGDTVNYSVGAFADETDVTIADVLKKMPGITVRQSGAVEYQGKPISHLYIEGMDLLKGRYGIATNNLSPKAISTVQVLENHQEVKALKNIQFPENAAINLKLKEDAKGVFALVAQLGLGGGDGVLWEDELLGTYFGKQRQHLLTYKANNTGVDLGRELRTLTRGAEALSSQFVQMQMPAPPGIEQSRYYFNNSHAASVNNVWKTRSGGEVNVNLVYLNDHEHRDSYEQTIYLLPDGMRTVVDEQMASAVTEDWLEGSFSYKQNAERKYVNEELAFSGGWQRGRGNLSGGQDIRQFQRINTFRLSNRLHYIRKSGDYKGVEVTSDVDMETKPQHLHIRPNLFTDLFPAGAEGADQQVEHSRVRTRNHFSLLSALMWKGIAFHPTGVLNLDYGKLDSELQPWMPEDGSSGLLTDSRWNNEAWLLRLSVGAGLRMSFRKNRFDVMVYVPVTYNYERLNQGRQEDNRTVRKVLVTPSARIIYSPHSRWDITGDYNSYYTAPSMGQLYAGYILTDYRTLTGYVPSLERTLHHVGTLSVDYKDVLNLFFAGLDASYTVSCPSVLYGYRLDGILARVITRDTDERGEWLNVRGRLSKSFFWKKLGMEVEGSWSQGTTPQLRQDEALKYRSQSATVRAKVSMSPFDVLSVDYEGIWQWGRTWNDGGAFPISRTWVSKASLELRILKGLFLSAGIEHYYNNQIWGNKSFELADAELKYQCGKTQFSLKWDNLFDVRNYTYTSMGDMNRYYSEYHIRPMSVLLSVRFNVL